MINRFWFRYNQASAAVKGVLSFLMFWKKREVINTETQSLLGPQEARIKAQRAATRVLNHIVMEFQGQVFLHRNY